MGDPAAANEHAGASAGYTDCLLQAEQGVFQTFQQFWNYESMR
jgi:hypothetical protein